METLFNVSFVYFSYHDYVETNYMHMSKDVKTIHCIYLHQSIGKNTDVNTFQEVMFINEYFRFRQILKRLVVKKWFDNLTLVFIVLNCLTVAMESPSIQSTSFVCLTFALICTKVLRYIF